MMYSAVVTHPKTRLRERAKARTKDEAVNLAKQRMLRAYPNLRHEKVRIQVIRTSV